MTRRQGPVHPGEILKHEVLDEMGISASKLAKRIHVLRPRIERLCEEKTSMTIDTAMRLSRALGTTLEFWMNLQLTYDLPTRRPGDLGDIRPLLGA